jgi:hypothetical protein
MPDAIQKKSPSLFRRAVHAMTGGGFGREYAVLDEMLPRMVALKAFTRNDDPYRTTAAREIATGIMNSGIAAAHASGTIGRAWAEAFRKFQPFVYSELSNWEAVASVPAYQGIRRNEARAQAEAQGLPYITGLEQQWKMFRDSVEFCMRHPSLPDLDRVRFIDQFARQVIERGWPGAAEMSAIASQAAASFLNSYPEADISLPANFATKNLPSWSDILKKPNEAARAYFSPISHSRGLTDLELFHFGGIAKQCRDAKYSPPGEGSIFSDQVAYASRKLVSECLSKLPPERHAELQDFAHSARTRADEVLASHATDLKAVEAMEVGNSASLVSGINAMRRIGERCPLEFARLSSGVVEKYVAYEETRARSRRVSLPQDVSPNEPISYERLVELMPKIADIEVSMHLSDFVKGLRTEVRSADAQAFEVLLVRGGSNAMYLAPLGKDNAYSKRGGGLLREATAQLNAFNAEEFLAGIDADRGSYFRQWHYKNWVDDRLKEFEVLRADLYQDIRKMLEQPMFITDQRFGGTVAMMERMRTANAEMHLHFANAFVHAWDNIPKMVLELALKPGSAELVQASTEEARVLRERERERERSMTRGMSMSM